MKILIVRMYPDYLNIKNYNCQEIGLAKALIRKGNQCDIVLYTDENEREEDIFFNDGDSKIHIYYLNAKKFFKNAFFSKKLYQIVDNYDVIQTAEYDQIGNVKLKKKCKNKMIIYHGPYASEYTKGYNKKCLISDLYYLFHKDYKDTPCISKSILATEFLKKKGFKDITTVGVGLDTERFKSNIEPNKDIKEIIENKEKEKLKYLLYIGKIEDRRNVTFLIDVLSEVSTIGSKIRLILVGKGDKEYIDKCFNYAKEKQVIDKIVYIPAVSQLELQSLYKKCDIFLLPTHYEIFGMVLLEAMYFGMPTITTLNGGSSTIIKNEMNGIICNLNDLSEWTIAIERILYDTNFRIKLKENAKRKIVDNNTWDNLVDRFIKVYKNIV